MFDSERDLLGEQYFAKGEEVTSTVDGTSTSIIWTALVRNTQTNINIGIAKEVISIFLLFFSGVFVNWVVLIDVLRKSLENPSFDQNFSWAAEKRSITWLIFWDLIGTVFNSSQRQQLCSVQTEHANQIGLPWVLDCKVDPFGRGWSSRRRYRQQQKLFCINNRHRWSLSFHSSEKSRHGVECGHDLDPDQISGKYHVVG